MVPALMPKHQPTQQDCRSSGRAAGQEQKTPVQWLKDKRAIESAFSQIPNALVRQGLCPGILHCVALLGNVRSLKLQKEERSLPQSARWLCRHGVGGKRGKKERSRLKVAWEIEYIFLWLSPVLVCCPIFLNDVEMLGP